MRSQRRVASAVLILIPIAILFAARPLAAGFGLRGSYYAGTGWQGEAFTRVDRAITTRSLTPLPRSLSGRPFSVRWNGFLHVDRPGRYVFQLVSDDGAWLEIDGRLVIDNGGDHGPVLQEQTIELTPGLHAVDVRFFQNLGGWRLDLLWAAEGQRPEPLDSPSLLHAPMRGRAYAAARLLHASLPYVPFFWLTAAFLLAIDLLVPLLRRLRVADALGDRALVGLLLLSVAVNVVGIWWGVNRRWAPDEILPSEVLEAIDLRFANGWHGPYPPFHYYILGLLYAPFLVAEWIVGGRIPVPFHLLNRGVSLVMAAGILALCHVTARTLNGRGAGLAAAALTALLLPFVYYAKTSNLDIPYLFWFSWSMLFYARIVVAGEAGAYAGFAIAAAIATATKDQAYGFFVGPFIHAAALRYVRLGWRSPGARWLALRDLVVPRAVLLGLVTFALAHNLPLNWTGFERHLDVLTVNAGDKYRMFPATLEGQLDSLWAALAQVRFAFGWPAFLLVIAALLGTTRHAEGRTRLWLLLPAVSYYCLFIVPVAIVFDRFMLGICILLAIVAGCAVADWTRSGGRARIAAVVCVGAACAYSAARAVSLDAMMLADSRYFVERWIATRVPPDAAFLSAGPRAFLPRVQWSTRIDPETADPADASPGEYVIVNATYARRFPASSSEGTFYERLRNREEFSLELQHRSSRRWFPLSRDPVFVEVEESQFTNLDKINPLIEVYRRK